MIDQEFAESPEGQREEIADLREKLEAARAELQRLQSSTAPDGQPILAEAFADNGAHSHWYLIDPKTGAKVWSEDPEECAARGFSVSSPAPVAGMVPDIADEDYESVAVLMYDHALGSHDDENEEFRRIVAATWQCCQAYAVDAARAASRIPAIKTGEVVVAMPDPTGIVVDLPERYRERGIELVRNAIQWAREHARIVPRAQATTSGGGTT